METEPDTVDTNHKPKFKGREALLGAKRRYVEVDGFRIQSLTAMELEDYRAFARRFLEKTKNAPFPSRYIVVRCLVDEKGERLFGNEEVAELEGVDGAIIEKLSDVCNIHCGLEVGSVERYLKNYDTPAA